ncbi:MAG: urea ABC transporter permease subunit UrtB [Mangrovicoccus sp.]|nr:urea ABC transporter permease subunit UrtB [Mangrovicoccus sp.]
MHFLLRLLGRVLGLCVLLIAPFMVQAQSFDDLVRALPEGKFDDRAKVIAQIAQTGDDRAADTLTALLEGNLHVLKADDSLVVISKRGTQTIAADALSGEDRGVVKKRGSKKIRVNNALRRELRAAIGRLTLAHPDPVRRLAAAEAAFKAADPSQIALLHSVLETEENKKIRGALTEAVAASQLADAEATTADKLDAISVLRKRGDQEALTLLSPLVQSDDPALAEAAEEAVVKIEQSKRLWGLAQNVWFGMSLGSVLLLAAIGLAITFGVMGVINMAHGELVMLGAYTTFAVQEAIRGAFPELFDWSLLIAAPLAFLVAGGVGVAIERGCVRYLYGRPLETLLATWGISLILQQTVRSIFGPNNREVGNPSWMSGAFELGQMTITYNRLWILLFALAVFFVLLFVLKKTPIGLQMRAVTQNRQMAADMGIRTGWVDAMTFGLGAGIAGLAGVALSQIDNVSPNLGQSYIVDSFMVVVFGGAGSIWGTLAAAFSLGIANKFMEPWTGAVLAKILVLVFIILFIQKRPRGLFAVRGRAVDQ